MTAITLFWFVVAAVVLIVAALGWGADDVIDDVFGEGDD